MILAAYRLLPIGTCGCIRSPGTAVKELAIFARASSLEDRMAKQRGCRIEPSEASTTLTTRSGTPASLEQNRMRMEASFSNTAIERRDRSTCQDELGSTSMLSKTKTTPTNKNQNGCRPSCVVLCRVSSFRI